jgi:hypothetical protein
MKDRKRWGCGFGIYGKSEMTTVRVVGMGERQDREVRITDRQ